MKIERSWHLPFAPKQVFEAWVSNDTVIPPATRMDIKPQVGGHYRLHAQGDGFTASNEGTFLVVDAPNKLRYTWNWLGDEDVTEVEVEFLPHDEGTHLLLRHGEFLTEESYTNHDNGWVSYVEGLTALMETG